MDDSSKHSMANNSSSPEKDVLIGSQGTVILEENKEDYLKYKNEKANEKLTTLKKVLIRDLN
jgi:hypothetical protein